MKLVCSKNTVKENPEFFQRKALLIVRNGPYISMAYVDTPFLNTAVTSLKTMFCRNHRKRLVMQLWCFTCQVLAYCKVRNLKTLSFASFL
jgi:hypothetical protein